MNPNRSTSNLQGVVYQYTYNAKKASGVCLQNTFDYSPFGVTLDGRTIENDFYRRGFNGMEKDDEVKGGGNSYDFGARMYDSRVGRWLSVDPLARKFTSISPYATFGNIPIIFVDPDGKDLIISGKTAVALQDIRSLVPKEYQYLIKVEASGKIIFNINDLPDEVKSYEGVALLNDLVKPGKNYNYKVGDELIGIDRGTNITYINKVGNADVLKDNPTAQGAILNFSITERTDLNKSDIENSIPEKGFDGAVLIQEGEFTRANSSTGTGEFSLERNTIVFHELLENKLRTENGKDYKGQSGAHKGASDKGDKFSKEVNMKSDKNAGTATGFKKNED
jgi:RHS repeat-associated protein